MKIYAVSDLHGKLPEIPECDLLLIAGDICPLVTHHVDFQWSWLETNFKSWLEKIPAKNVVMTFGNHDFVSEHYVNSLNRLNLRAKILINQTTESNGLKIWGSPYSLWFHDWAWNAFEDELKSIYSLIPDDADIIITHGPPKFFGDKTAEGEHVGSVSLAKELLKFDGIINVCGHIHEGYGLYVDGSCNKIYNCSLVNRKYEPVNPLMKVSL